MHAKYEVSISYGSKVIAKVKVDNRQTNKQTDRQMGGTKTKKTRSFDPGHKIELDVGCVIEFEAGDEQSKMADDELVAMDLRQ